LNDEKEIAPDLNRNPEHRGEGHWRLLTIATERSAQHILNVNESRSDLTGDLLIQRGSLEKGLLHARIECDGEDHSLVGLRDDPLLHTLK
jgi:hypothetical protein